MRTTLFATVVVALALAIAAAGIVWFQRRQLEAALTDLARQQSAGVVTNLRAGMKPREAVSGTGGSDTALVQIVDRHGEVLAASAAIAGEPRLTSLTVSVGEERVLHDVRAPTGEEEPFVLVLRGVATAQGPVVVLAAQSLESVSRSERVTTVALLVGSPAILLVVALTSYWLTGRALAPVESMRRRVAGIGLGDLSERVPVTLRDDEISRLGTTMNAMLGRLESGAAAQRRFAADASHEMRSPLAGIRASAEVALNHPGAVNWRSAAGDVLAETERLEHLVSDLLLLARADEQGLPLRMTEVDLDELAGAEAARARNQHRVALVVQATPVRLSGDEDQLRRALRNVVDNAVRHADSTVVIRTYRDRGGAVVEVTDDGPGIPVADRQRVFERFVRLDTSRQRSSGGVGLGLAIAAEIIRSHRGTIAVDTGPSGRGCVVSLWLPEDRRESGVA
jgi:signal transduction histidine kinase